MVAMDLAAIPREFPQFGRSLRNLARPQAKVFSIHNNGSGRCSDGFGCDGCNCEEGVDCHDCGRGKESNRAVLAPPSFECTSGSWAFNLRTAATVVGRTNGEHQTWMAGSDLTSATRGAGSRPANNASDRPGYSGGDVRQKPDATVTGTGDDLLCVAAQPQCCIEIWCEPVILTARHCAILVIECNGSITSFELRRDLKKITGTIVAIQGPDGADSHAPGYIVRDNVPLDAKGEPTPQGPKNWQFHNRCCIWCAGCLDPCLWPGDTIRDYPHLKKNYAEFGANSNTFASWYAAQFGCDTPAPAGARGW